MVVSISEEAGSDLIKDRLAKGPSMRLKGADHRQGPVELIGGCGQSVEPVGQALQLLIRQGLDLGCGGRAGHSSGHLIDSNRVGLDIFPQRQFRL